MAGQITCITKPDPHNSHEAITHVGGVRANGTGFYITRQECAADIVNRQDTYFVRAGQNRIGVEAYQRQSVWYIKTRPDHTQKDNLLNLPQCQTVNRLIRSSGDSRCSGSAALSIPDQVARSLIPRKCLRDLACDPVRG
jgi:Protein of unknown function (DUF3892)